MEELAVGTRVDHPRYGEGIVSKNKITSYEIFFERGGKIEITKRNEDLSVIDTPEEKPKNSLTLKEVEKVLRFVLEEQSALQEIVPLGEIAPAILKHARLRFRLDPFRNDRLAKLVAQGDHAAHYPRRVLVSL